MNPPAHPKDHDTHPDERPNGDNPRAFDSAPYADVRALDDIQLEALAQRVEAEALRRSPEERGAVAFAEVYTAADLGVRQRTAKAREDVRFITAGLTSFIDRRDRRAGISQSGEPLVNHTRERVEMTTTVKRGVFAGTYTVWAEVYYGGRFGVTKRAGRFFRMAARQFSGGRIEGVLEELASHLSLIER